MNILVKWSIKPVLMNYTSDSVSEKSQRVMPTVLTSLNYSEANR